MRYEINTDSEIVEYSGNSVQFISNQEDILKSLFSQGVYECISILHSGCEWSIEYQNTINKISKKITLYYGNIRNEDRNNKEKKIQLNVFGGMLLKVLNQLKIQSMIKFL